MHSGLLRILKVDQLTFSSSGELNECMLDTWICAAVTVLLISAICTPQHHSLSLILIFFLVVFTL